MTLQGSWHSAGLTCKIIDFEVEKLMVLIQHASSKLKKTLPEKGGTNNSSHLGPI